MLRSKWSLKLKDRLSTHQTPSPDCKFHKKIIIKLMLTPSGGTEHLSSIMLLELYLLTPNQWTYNQRHFQIPMKDYPFNLLKNYLLTFSKERNKTIVPVTRKLHLQMWKLAAQSIPGGEVMVVIKGLLWKICVWKYKSVTLKGERSQLLKN